MEIIVNTNAAVDAELAKLAALEGKSSETLGHELATCNFMGNLQVMARAARRAALRRVMAPTLENTGQAAYTPIDWGAVDRPASPRYAPIEWPALPARAVREEMRK